MTIESKQLAWNWVALVNSVASDIDSGLSSDELSSKYANQVLEDEGEIIRLEIEDDPNCRPFAQLNMLPVEVRLVDGRSGIVDFLALQISERSVDEWKKYHALQKIRFRTQLKEGFGPFPGVDWSDIGENKGYIKFSTKNSEPMDSV